MLCLRFAEHELHRRPRPGAGHRHRRHLPGDGHPAPGPPGHLRPLGLLAASGPTFGSDEPTSRVSGPGSAAGSPPSPRKVWIVTAGLLAIACLGLFRLDASGLSTEDTYTKEFDSIKGQQLLADHGLADNSNTVQVVANTDARPEVQEALAGIDGLGEATPAQDLGTGRSYFEATINADISSPAAFGIVESSRDAVHGVEGADALVGGGAAFYLDTKVASTRDNKVIIPIVLIVVFLILVCC